tara:strand:- start:5927 stop:6280 length:354 start_codon:yes stop_codon:yes gene_type:complete
MTDEIENTAFPPTGYTVVLRNGRCVNIEEMSDSAFKKFAHKQLRAVRKVIYGLCSFKAEAEKRGYDGDLESLYPYKDYNIFQMMTHATLISVNQYNTFNPDTPLEVNKGDDEEDEEE